MSSLLESHSLLYLVSILRAKWVLKLKWKLIKERTAKRVILWLTQSPPTGLSGDTVLVDHFGYVILDFLTVFGALRHYYYPTFFSQGEV